jgi:hypothetical protein
LKHAALEPRGGSRISGWRGLVMRTLGLLDHVAGPISEVFGRR